MNVQDITTDDRGSGRPLLLLHGGAGPGSVLPFAQRLVDAGGVRAVTPTHPGFSGTPRPEKFRTPADLTNRYVRLLDELDLRDVTVVGFSLGGWIASEIALRQTPRVGRVIVVDGMGIEVDGHAIADVSGLTPSELAALSYHDPGLAPDPTTLTEDQRAQMRANIATVIAYGGPMFDPELRARLAAVSVPALVVWGESDGIADPDYGRAYATAFAHGRFELLARAGHVPQIEQPAALADAILAFVGEEA